MSPRKQEIRENLVCPFCSRRFTVRSGFRGHIVLNACGSVPVDVSCSLMATEGKTIREDEFQRYVLAVAEQEGWLTCHVRRSIMSDGRILTATSSPGFPDLVLVRPPQLVFLELKSHRGKPSPDQRVWIRSIQACDGSEAYVVRPGDWREILRLLARTPGAP